MKVLVFILLFLGSISCNNKGIYLNDFFEQLEIKSPKEVLKEFKDSSLDSVILNNRRYDAIWVETAGIILADSTEAAHFNEFLKLNNLEYGDQSKWTIIAAFHKYLHGEPYQIPELLDQMNNLSNEINGT